MAHHHHPAGAPAAGAIRDYRKGNWTLQETMVLIEAKKMDDERRQLKKHHHHHHHHHGMMMVMPMQHGQKGKPPTELRWKWVEDYCWSKGCYRSQNQCNDKWDNLMRDYKKVRDFQRRRGVSGAGASDEGGVDYWRMERGERKERNLPTNMSPEIYEALVEVVERGGGSAAGMPPAAGGGSEESFNVGGENAPFGGVLLPPLGLSLPPAVEAPAPAGGQAPVELASTSSAQIEEDPESSQAKRRKSSQEQIQVHPLQLHEQQERREQMQEQQEELGRATTRGNHDSPIIMTTTPSSLQEAIAAAISSSASVIAQAVRASHESDERRHREMMSLQERMLEIDKSKLELNSAMVDAINKLATSINTLANSYKP